MALTNAQRQAKHRARIANRLTVELRCTASTFDRLRHAGLLDVISMHVPENGGASWPIYGTEHQDGTVSCRLIQTHDD